MSLTQQSDVASGGGLARVYRALTDQAEEVAEYVNRIRGAEENSALEFNNRAAEIPGVYPLSAPLQPSDAPAPAGPRPRDLNLDLGAF